MAILTFTSDFGTRDHYVAAVKAKISAFNPNIKIVDITHDIEHFNIAHGAFVLNSVFRDFPAGTVHLVAIHSQGREKDKFIALKQEEHFFVGADNGLFSLLSDKTPTAIAELNYDKNLSSTFPEKNVFVPAAVSLANGASVYDLGKQLLSINKLYNRTPIVKKNSLVGYVMHVDDYGNLITNITKQLFNSTAQNRAYFIKLNRENIHQLSDSYYDVEDGDWLAFFNSMGTLEIAVKKGDASRLLGLRYDSEIQINFVPEIE